MKTVNYKGLTITGDANKIDEVIYGAKENEVEIIEDDMLNVIDEVYAFNARFIPERKDMTTQETVDWVKQFIVCIYDELSELLGELSWKHWKDYSDYKMNLDNVKGEIADILIFSFGIAGILDIPPKEIIGEITKKNEVNNTRQDKGY